jgi:hypothetical protein
MKTQLILLSLVSFACAQDPSPAQPPLSTKTTQISTFSGDEVEWGWSGKEKGLYSKEAVVGILQENWGKVSPFDLQAKVDQVTFAEFLWKITPDLVDQAVKSGSSFIVGNTKVDSLVINLEPSGKGEIIIISQGVLVGRVRCQSAATREGKNSQITAGDHKLLRKEGIHISKEFRGAKMPKALLLDASRGIWIHCGDLSSTSGGCIRVSEPVGRELYKLTSIGTNVKVVWE